MVDQDINEQMLHVLPVRPAQCQAHCLAFLMALIHSPSSFHYRSLFIVANGCYKNLQLIDNGSHLTRLLSCQPKFDICCSLRISVQDLNSNKAVLKSIVIKFKFV